MNYTMLCQPSFSLLEVEMEAGESIVSESGAMAWMTEGIHTETTTRGGFLAGLKRKLLSGESFFQNTYTAEEDGALVALAPGAPGDIIPYELDDAELFLEKGAYLASTEDVHCDSKWQGFKGLFSEGLFALRVTGTGTLFFNAYGGVQEVYVNGEYLVDNGYAVAWEPTLQYRLTKARKIRSFLFSDQILLRFMGRGRLWVQSRSPHTLANWAHPFRPERSSN